MAFMPAHVHLMVISLLLTGLGLTAAGAVLIYALVTDRRPLLNKTVIGAGAIGATYLVLLLGASLLSSEQVLDQGEPKYFCEIDCHIAYSVEYVTTTKTLGSGSSRATAAGQFYVIVIRTWFDAETTSAGRGDAPLNPNPRGVRVFDDRGRRFRTSLEGMQALEGPAGKSVPLWQGLRPGDSYETSLVFDLPADAENPRLLLADTEPLTLLLVGHENSLLHKKVYFSLAGPANALSADWR